MNGGVRYILCGKHVLTLTNVMFCYLHDFDFVFDYGFSVRN